MIYPSEFVDRVSAEYADRPDVRAAAEGGMYALGIHLARWSAMTMSPEDIVSAIDSGDCGHVREEAERAVRRRRLHAEWMRIILRSLSAPPGPHPSSRRPQPAHA